MSERQYIKSKLYCLMDEIYNLKDSKMFTKKEKQSLEKAIDNLREVYNEF